MPPISRPLVPSPEEAPVAVTDDLPYPRYLAASAGSFEGVVIAMNIDPSVEGIAPGLTDELVRAVHGALAARQEFTSAEVTRADVTRTDITPTT